tara:strand:- start:722 stop:946 length:225 start_codon:yes stop_codon:yes gene_type:complete
MKEARQINILGIPLIKILWRSDKDYRSYKIILFKLFLFGCGFALNEHAEHIHISIGITKLELFWSFSIKKRWLM